MDETTFRILDTLSRALGKPLSINELNRKMQELHGTAYYANTYRKLQALTEQGSITLTKAGQSSLATLNFGNYPLIDMLAEMEIKRKQTFLEKQAELQMLFMEIETYCSQMSAMISVSATRPERNRKLNRAELLILLHPEGSQHHEQTLAIHNLMQIIQRMHTIRIDYLILSGSELSSLLASEEKNPVQEMLADEIAILNPQGLWYEIRNAHQHGLQIKTSEKETNPSKIPERNIIHNLARFGYKELGPALEKGEGICIEYIITAILMEKDARRIAAIPIILAKNRPNYNLLTFLSQKYGLSGRLLGLLKALDKIRHTKETEAAIKSLEAMNVKEIEADEENIMKKMRLYNA
ncbi:MAG: hypothetical protein HYY22_11380 [Thaumarchaeota archaeon]|nr:hypothetical protein [Nitrososphaerota archaeon]